MNHKLEARLEDGFSLILACHDRIRRVTQGIAALAALEDPLDPRARPTAAYAVRYLREGLVLHAEDEDLSLAPALMELPDALRVALAIDRMEEEHGRIERELRVASRLLEDWLAAPGAPPRRVLGAAEWLQGVLIPHIEREERDIFPFATALSPPVRARMHREILGRRHV